MSVTRRTVLAALVALAFGSPALAGDSKVVWHKSMSDAYRASVAEKKPMLVCFTDSSPFAVKQQQMFADGALDPFHDRAVFVYADPEKDDKFGNIKKKVEELGVKQFPTMILLTSEKLVEVDRIEGNKSRDEIQKWLVKMLKVPAVEWHTIQFEKANWFEELAKVYDKAAAAKLPVAILFISPGCQPGKECACVKYARDLVPTAAFRAFADKAVFVLAEIPSGEAKAEQAVIDRADYFRKVWNVNMLPALVVIDPTAGGARERSRIVGRFDADQYFPRLVEAFDVKAEVKLLSKLAVKPATMDDLVKILGDRKVAFERTKDGGFKTTATGTRPNSKPVELPAEVRLSDDNRRIVLTVTAGDLPADADAQKQIADTIAKARAHVLGEGPVRFTTEGGKVRVTIELFGDLASPEVIAHQLMTVANLGASLKGQIDDLTKAR